TVPVYSLNELAVLFEAAFFSPDNYELKIAIGTNTRQQQAVSLIWAGVCSPYGSKIWSGIYWQVTQAGTYQLIADSITQLTAAGVPNDVTTAINSLLGTVYENRDLFDAALQQQLTTAQFDQYRVNIYTYSLLNAVFYALKPLATSLVSKSDILCAVI
ncbi:hypothetical protein, partial [Chryseobacterium indoltheticum]|uniref:hypothetical protein n=1 Tax=Chryseobacterium indoltheticum TaxID=254 RepID=UPI003F497B47